MFKNPAQRAAYFEQLRSQGKLGQQPMGAPPMQKMAQVAASPLTPPTSMPKMAQPPQQMPALKANVAPNPLKPLNPAGADKFGRIKKMF